VLADSPAGCELTNIKNLFGHVLLLVNLWLRGDSSHLYVEQCFTADIVQCPSAETLVVLELAPFLNLWSASGYTGTVPYLQFVQPFLHFVKLLEKSRSPRCVCTRPLSLRLLYVQIVVDSVS